MASNTIDLDQAEQAVSSLLSNDEQRQGYQSKTLKEHNRSRCVYLPLFPTISYGPNDHLLLTNVPGSFDRVYLSLIFSFYCRLVTRLATHEILRREHGAYTSDALMLMNNYNYSTNDGFTLLEQDAKELAARLCVGPSIITFNAERLRGNCYSLLALHESFRRNILHKRDTALAEPVLNSKQMAVALEFYLQIDGMSCTHNCNYIDFSMFFSGHILHENLFVSWS